MKTARYSKIVLLSGMVCLSMGFPHLLVPPVQPEKLRVPQRQTEPERELVRLPGCLVNALHVRRR